MITLLRRTFNAIRRLLMSLRRPQAGWMKTPLGFEMQMDLTDPLDQGFYLGYYERPLIAVIDALVSAGATCVDVGAQKGYVTLRLAQRVGPSGSVLSFDPDHRAFRLLESNCQRNGASNVVLHPIALGTDTSTLRLFLNKQLGNTSAFPNEFAQPLIEEEVEIPVRRFDDVIAARPGAQVDVAFVKIDADGAEALALAGMRETLRRATPAIAIELNHKSLACAGTSGHEIGAFLRGPRYELFRCDLLREGLQRRLIVTPYDENWPQNTHMDDIVSAVPGTRAFAILQTHATASGRAGAAR